MHLPQTEWLRTAYKWQKSLTIKQQRRFEPHPGSLSREEKHTVFGTFCFCCFLSHFKGSTGRFTRDVLDQKQPSSPNNHPLLATDSPPPHPSSQGTQKSTQPPPPFSSQSRAPSGSLLPPPEEWHRRDGGRLARSGCREGGGEEANPEGLPVALDAAAPLPGEQEAPRMQAVLQGSRGDRQAGSSWRCPSDLTQAAGERPGRLEPLLSLQLGLNQPMAASLSLCLEKEEGSERRLLARNARARSRLSSPQGSTTGRVWVYASKFLCLSCAMAVCGWE